MHKYFVADFIAFGLMNNENQLLDMCGTIEK